MRVQKSIPLLFISCLILSGYIFTYSKINYLRENLPAENKRAEALLVSPELLEIVSGEFSTLLADYLLLKASFFLGGTYETLPEDWETIWHLFNQSHYLDPLFFQTCYYTQALLVMRKALLKRAIGLVESSAKHRTWDWEPNFFAGFDYYYYLKDYDKSAKLLKNAAKFNDAPPIVATLGARIAKKGGQTQDALNLLYVMYHQAKDKPHTEIIKKRINAYKGILILENAVKHYEKQFGNKPDSLKQLVEKKIIIKLPLNPFGGKYYYDTADGMITFDNIITN